MIRKKKLKRKPRKRRKRKKPKRKPLRSSTTLLKEIKILLIKQELKLSIQLFPKKILKRKILVILPLTTRKPQMMHPKVKLLTSPLTTTKEEEPLQLLETP